MTKSIIAVCVGAPLLALGFGAAPAAWAAPGGLHGASVSVNGDPKHQGDGVAESEPSTGRAPNVAVAVKGSFAQAATETEPGSGNHAVAVNHSLAFANDGANNTAVATNFGCALATGGGATDTQHGSGCGQ
jgi:hypothetical protein